MSESRIRKSPTLGAFFAAMAKVQGTVEDPFKSAPSQYGQYADLVTTIKNNRVRASENGICIIQLPFSDGPVAGTTVIIGHESGEWIEADFALPMQKVTCQGGGSAVSYARRYQVQGLLNIAPTSEQMRAAPEPLPVEPERMDQYDPGDDDGETAESERIGKDLRLIAAAVKRMAGFATEDELKGWAESEFRSVTDPSVRARLTDAYKSHRKRIRDGSK